MEFIRGKTILVTGGCGSIGSEIVRQVLRYEPKEVRVLDNNESGHFHLNHSVKTDLVRNIVGDIKDRNGVYRAVQGADIVFHAAALKHVPLCETNPFEAVSVNVIGTQNLVEAAIDQGVDLFVGISTDKAVNPINTMGATKLLSEKIIVNAPITDSEIKLACVRFGNVMDSVGSVIPLFRKQIEEGGPVTLTHPEMTRFFMSIPDSVDATLRAAEMAEGREVFVLKMRSMRILDLAKVLIRKLAQDPEKIMVDMVGQRPGEKLHESLFTEEEAPYITEKGDLYILRNSAFGMNPTPGTGIAEDYSSFGQSLLSEEEIESILYADGIFSRG